MREILVLIGAVMATGAAISFARYFIYAVFLPSKAVAQINDANGPWASR